MRKPRENTPNRCYRLISRMTHRAFFLSGEERTRFVEMLLRVAVPGPDGKFGYGGKCFPKDVNALTKMTVGFPLNALLAPPSPPNFRTLEL